MTTTQFRTGTVAASPTGNGVVAAPISKSVMKLDQWDIFLVLGVVMLVAGVWVEWGLGIALIVAGGLFLLGGLVGARGLLMNEFVE